MVDLDRWVVWLTWLVRVVLVGAGVAGGTDIFVGLLCGHVVDDTAAVAVLKLLWVFGGASADHGLDVSAELGPGLVSTVGLVVSIGHAAAALVL